MLINSFYSDDKKKCPCSSNKHYKNCCKSDDIFGDFDKDNIFFCDLERFQRFVYSFQNEKNGKNNYSKNGKNHITSDIIQNNSLEKKVKNSEVDIVVIEKQMDKIYI